MKPLEKARRQAANLLARRDHTRRQLEVKLSRRHSKAAVRQVIGELAAAGLLDDESVALERARNCRHQRLWGDGKIRADLGAKGISATIVSRVLNKLEQEHPQNQCLLQLIRSRVNRHGPPETASQAKRLFDSCLRRGFDAESVRQSLEPFLKSLDWDN